MRLHFQLDFFSLFTKRLLRKRRSISMRIQRARLVAARASPRRTQAPAISDPQLLALWQRLQAEYFPERADLLQYTVFWSNRAQRRVLGSCHMRSQRVRVARELQALDCQEWLEPLLYHEMCHAVIGLGVERSSKGRAWHGATFRALERRHPRVAALDVWIRSGGWAKAVRSARAKRTWEKRRASSKSANQSGKIWVDSR
jgi:hypothetical protein